MKKFLNEGEVSIALLVAHIADSGVDHDPQPGRIVLHTESGIGYQVTLDEDRKFIRFMTFFPVSAHVSDEQKREFEHRLNSQVFMASFWIDDDNDLVVDCPLPYGHGLIAGQFMAVLHRFASMLNFVISAKNEEGLILFGPNGARSEDDEDIGPEAVPAYATGSERYLN